MLLFSCLHHRTFLRNCLKTKDFLRAISTINSHISVPSPKTLIARLSEKLHATEPNICDQMEQVEFFTLHLTDGLLIDKNLLQVSWCRFRGLIFNSQHTALIRKRYRRDIHQTTETKYFRRWFGNDVVNDTLIFSCPTLRP